MRPPRLTLALLALGCSPSPSPTPPGGASDGGAASDAWRGWIDLRAQWSIRPSVSMGVTLPNVATHVVHASSDDQNSRYTVSCRVDRTDAGGTISFSVFEGRGTLEAARFGVLVEGVSLGLEDPTGRIRIREETPASSLFPARRWGNAEQSTQLGGSNPCHVRIAPQADGFRVRLWCVHFINDETNPQPMDLRGTTATAAPEVGEFTFEGCAM